MADVYTMLIEGDQNPSEGDVYLYLMKSRDFFGEPEVTFYGKDSKSGERIQHSFLISSVGWIAGSMNRLKIEGVHRITDERPSVCIPEYNLTKKTGEMTYTLPKNKQGEVSEDDRFSQEMAIA